MTSRGSPSASGYADASFTQGTGSGPPPATFQQDLGRPEIELGVSLSGAVPPPNLCKGKNEAYERAERLLERAIRSRVHSNAFGQDPVRLSTPENRAPYLERALVELFSSFNEGVPSVPGALGAKGQENSVLLNGYTSTLDGGTGKAVVGVDNATPMRTNVTKARSRAPRNTNTDPPGFGSFKVDTTVTHQSLQQAHQQSRYLAPPQLQMDLGNGRVLRDTGIVKNNQPQTPLGGLNLLQRAISCSTTVTTPVGPPQLPRMGYFPPLSSIPHAPLQYINPPITPATTTIVQQPSTSPPSEILEVPSDDSIISSTTGLPSLPRFDLHSHQDMVSILGYKLCKEVAIQIASCATHPAVHWRDFWSKEPKRWAGFGNLLLVHLPTDVMESVDSDLIEAIKRDQTWPCQIPLTLTRAWGVAILLDIEPLASTPLKLSPWLEFIRPRFHISIENDALWAKRETRTYWFRRCDPRVEWLDAVGLRSFGGVELCVKCVDGGHGMPMFVVHRAELAIYGC